MPEGTNSPTQCRAPGRRELRRLDRREAIIAVAAGSFLEHGYAGTTMSSIAATLGGSKGTLWNHFDSKESLFEAVIDSKTGAFRARLSEILEPCDDLPATLRRFCTGLVEKVTSPDTIALYRLVVAEAGRFPEMGRIFYDRAPRQTWQLLGRFLVRAMDRGEIRRGDPIETARILISLCLAGCHQRLLVGEIDAATPELIALDVERALGVFLRAFGMGAMAR